MEAKPPDDLPSNPDPETMPETEPDLGWGLQAEPVVAPGGAGRRFLTAITLVVIAAFVVVGGLGGSGFFISSPQQSPATSEPPSSPATPAPQGVSPAARLAVIDANGALSSMAADGGSVATYSGLDTTFAFPAWSPDGTRLAAIATSEGGGEINVFQVPASGGPADAMTIAYQSRDSPPFYLYWSPDGRSIGFLTNEPPGGIGLHQVPADGSGIDRLVRFGAPMYWQWVDSTRMFVHSGLPGTSDNFLGEVAIDSLDNTPTTATPGAFRAPALSGGGDFLAYGSRNAGGSATVVAESRDGTTHQEVAVFGTSAFEFGPLGDTLAFVAATSSNAGPDLPLGPLRALDPASGDVSTLLGGTVVAFFWSPDGSTIAALRVIDPGSTPVVARGEPIGLLAKAAAPTSSARGILGNAAGTLVKLAFVDVASASIRSEITVRLSDLYIGQVLPFFDQYALSHRVWSPDSSSIVLPLDDDQGVSRITIIPADGSDTRAVTEGVMAFWSP